MGQLNLLKQTSTTMVTPPAGYVGLYYDSGAGEWKYMDENGVFYTFDSTVTSVSLIPANGFTGTIATPSTTPAITLGTSLTTPVIAGNGTALVAATTTGTGSTVALSNSPSLISPALDTPSALVGTNITGTGAGFTAGHVTTNANLTGPIISVGNATSVGAQTGTGSIFVMQNVAVINPKNIEGVVYVDSANTQGWTGSDVGAWINSAFAYLQATYTANYGGTIQIAPGTYSFSTPIVCALTGFSVILRGSGDGNGGTVLNYTATTGTAITLGGGSGNHGGAQIENLSLLGTSSGNAATGLFWGVTSTGSIAGATAKNISIDKFGTGEAMLTNGQAYAIMHINCKIQNCAIGYVPAQENNTWYGGLIGSCGTGISATNPMELQMFGTAFDDNTTIAINMTNALARLTMKGCRFENPSVTTADTYITQTAGSINMSGGGFQTDASTGNNTVGFTSSSAGTLAIKDTWVFSSGRTYTQLFGLSGTVQCHIDPVIAPMSTGVTGATPLFTSGYAAKRLDWTRLTNTTPSAVQSAVTVAGTPVYITNSNLNMPTTLVAGIAIGTKFVWDFTIAKTAAGTGAFNIIIYGGVNGTTADTAIVTQNMGTNTAVADSMSLVIIAQWTAVGASGTFAWSIGVSNKAAAATGFGIAAGVAGFSGTSGAFNTTTAGLKFGIGFTNVTGTPTVQVAGVQAVALNLD